MSVNPKRSVSIVVPSYNRVETLFELVDDLEKAQRNLEFDVNIINDHGPELECEKIRTYSEKKLKNISFRRNETNMGIDGNIDRSLLSADTSYVLAVGDDDRINIDHLVEFIKFLEVCSDDLVIVNYSYIYSDLKIQRSGVIGIDGTPSFESMDAKKAFLFDYGTKLGFLGSVAFKCDAYNEVCDQGYIGTWFSHVGVALDIIFSEDRRVSYWSKPVVLNRAGDMRVTSWSGKFFDIIMGWWSMMEKFCSKTPGIEFLEYKAHKSDVTFQYDSIKWILSRRAENLVSFSALPILAQKFDMTLTLRAKYNFACLLPVWLCSILKQVARRFDG